VRRPKLIAILTGTVIGSFVGGTALTGCNVLRPSSKSPEYDSAKRDIESYMDQDGNYVRPEGLKGEKKKSSSAFSEMLGLGEKPADKAGAREAYLEGDKLFESAKNSEGDERFKLFEQAAKKYKSAAKLWKSSAMEQDALFMAGESYFFADKLPAAEDMYVRLIKDYPRTKFLDKTDQRRMEIALFYLRYDAADPQAFYELNFTDRRRPWNDTRRNGVRVLDKMRMDNPTGRQADDATMELANEAFRRENYLEAREKFEDLRVTYPDSPHQFEAHFLGLKSAIETYQGAQYASEPLDEAEKLIKKLLKQFPNESKEHREYIDRAYAEIRYKKAERLHDQAAYRIARGENNAAKVYLDQILVEFSDTPFADQAKASLAKIAPLPGEPTRHFQWLAEIFPESSRTRPLLEAKGDVK
jgi:outer membrane protein assembly factor BamD (BamD/ComL family)